MAYTVQILDANLNYKATLRNLQVIDNNKTFLKYSKKLSDWGTCTFRVGTKDPVFSSTLGVGDILTPFKYHVRILRDGVKVWQGVIVRNPKRTRYFIDIEARTYLYILDKILIKHDASVNTGDGKDNYKTFNSGTMAAAVTTLVNEAKAKANASNAISQLAVGTIENPNFPANFTDNSNPPNPVTGPFTFNSTYNTVQFSYHSTLYALKALGIYGICDFEITDDLVFNWKVYLGNKLPQIVLTFSNTGQIIDYNVPLDGVNMANTLWGIAADFNGNIIHTQKSANDSVSTYGVAEGVAAFSDVKNQGLLDVRVTEQLRLVDTPDEEIHVVMNEKGYPLGQWGIGDSITINIKDHIINVNAVRRIVGYEVDVKDNGQEEVLIVTNSLRDTQV